MIKQKEEVHIHKHIEPDWLEIGPPDARAKVHFNKETELRDKLKYIRKAVTDFKTGTLK